MRAIEYAIGKPVRKLDIRDSLCGTSASDEHTIIQHIHYIVRNSKALLESLRKSKMLKDVT